MKIKNGLGNSLIFLCMVVGVCGNPVRAEEQGDFTIAEEDATVITSKRLTFDQENAFALFEENVIVRDPSLRMRSDRLIVQFDDNNRAKLVEAEGRVIIQQEGTTAWAGKATYDVISGKIFMEQTPRIRRGRDVLEGDTITFWRDDNKLVCEPRARLVLFPEDDGPRGLFFGEQGGGR